MTLIKARSKSLRDTEVPAADCGSLAALLSALSRSNRAISVHRLRLTYLKEGKQVPIADEAFFEGGAASLEGLELYVKDLGPQISWRLVFVIEYFGPLLVHALVYYLSLDPEFVARYGSAKGAASLDPQLKSVVFVMVMGHYLKREFETLFVHKFTLATMPLFNVFKNSFHYWVLNGAIALGYLGYGFALKDCCYRKVLRFLHLDNLQTLVALFVLSETWNGYIHLRLRLFGDEQRKHGNNSKRVPLSTGIFKVLVAPNYTFEVWSWVWFALVFKLNVFSVLFLLVSATQMYLWAMKKNRRYGTRRAFLIPFIF